MSLPHFFKDDSDSMKYEETIDFFISWTIRCADKKYESEPTAVHSYSKIILSSLIPDKDNFMEYPFFENVRVWKQWNNVDIWAEFEMGPEKKRFALIMEDKMYSSIRPDQLQKYKNLAYEFYKGDNSINIKFVLLRPDYEMNVKHGEERKCQDLGYL